VLYCSGMINKGQLLPDAEWKAAHCLDVQVCCNWHHQSCRKVSSENYKTAWSQDCLIKYRNCGFFYTDEFISNLLHRLWITEQKTSYIYCAGRCCFTQRLCSWKTWHWWNTKFPFKTVFFLAVRVLPTSFSLMYNDYATSGHTDLRVYM